MESNDLSKLNFMPSPEEINSAFDRGKAKADLAVGEILRVSPSERTFSTIIEPFEKALSDLDDVLRPLGFLYHVSVDKKVREAAQKMEEEYSKYCIDLFAVEELYEAIAGIKDKDSLVGEDKKLFKSLMRSFKLNGMGLPKDKRTRLVELNKKLSELELEFHKNIAEHNDWLEVEKEQLKGLPEDFVKNLEVTKEGKYKIALDYPTYFGFMRNASDAEAREKLHFKFGTVAAEENSKLLRELIDIRAETANLLGYETSAHMIVEELMAKSPEKIESFLRRLESKLKEKGKKELDILLEYKKKDDPNATKLASWEIAYYVTKMKKDRFNLDTEKVKEYFPLNKVLTGTFKLYESILGIKIKELQSQKSWHDEVRAFSVSDSFSGEVQGHFYLDLFPREGKFTHAAVMRVLDGKKLEDGSHQKPVAAMVCNFTKPVKDKPSLLTHGEVETFFHEFGHVMHDLLNKSKRSSFTATSGVSRDFVEAPSQMLENWMWKKEALDIVSSHYKTGEKLPEETFKSLVELKKFCGIGYLHQLFLAIYDQILHTKGGDPNKLWKELEPSISLVQTQEGTSYEARFGHIGGGYEARYYGYLWSEVYAADMFSRFEKEGILNPKVGMDYRKFILEPAIIYEEEEYVSKFLGRKPNEEAFLRSMGVD